MWKTQRINDAMSLNFKLYPLNSILFTETSPSPVKYALSRMGKCQNILRKPLVSVQKNTEKRLKMWKNLKTDYKSISLFTSLVAYLAWEGWR